jgi:DNA-directed RNA polymerase subunit RPC12/RpoP
MDGSRQTGKKEGVVPISARDILFECPACGKSLVVDEAAEGLTIACPQCHINIIVPPGQTESPVPSPPSGAKSAAGTRKSSTTPEQPGTSASQERLATLNSQLKELQTQRTELTGRIASRINEINRDLVLLARLDTSHQQILTELGQLAAQLGATSKGAGSGSAQQPTVVGSSVTSSHARVSFQP